MPRLAPWILLMALALAGCAGPEAGDLADLPGLPATRGRPAVRASVEASIAPPQDAPADWHPAGTEQPWRYIVVHHSSTPGGSAAAFDQFHRAPPRYWDELGYHFVITNGNGGTDGTVEVGPRWAKQKWGAHTGGTPDNEFNQYGIGICLVGDFTGRLPSERQLASLERLVRFLAARYAISPARVLGHRDAPNARTDCPGDRFHPFLVGEFRQGLGRASAGR